MRKTLTELSHELNVSTATLSRALNGDSRVSAATRERILSALEAQNYIPRTRRRSVAAQNADTAMIIAGQLSNPITLGYIDGIRRRLAESGIRSLLSLSDYDSGTECGLIRYASSSGYAGIFMLNVVESPALIELMSGLDVPVVLVNRYLKALDTDVVTVDNYRSGYVATQYLLSHGHTYIAHIAGPETSITCRNRTQGYIDALNAAGLRPDPACIFYGDRKYPSGYEFGRRIAAMENRCTAVFSTTALMASGMTDALRDCGLSVPGDISVICNDDYSKDYMPCNADITCYRQNPQLMGRTAAELLIERIARHDIPPRRVVFPPELCEKDSVRRV